MKLRDFFVNNRKRIMFPFLSTLFFAFIFYLIPLETHAWPFSGADLINALKDGFWTLAQHGLSTMVILTLNALSFFVALAAGILNLSVYISIEVSSGFLSDSGKLLTIWRTMRDFANIALIFGLLYTAFLIMLRIASGKKMLSSILIVALLINFSGLFTRLAIDVSNRLTLTFYYAITGESSSGNPVVISDDPGKTLLSVFLYSNSETGESRMDSGLANIIMNQMALSSIYSSDSTLTGEVIAENFTAIVALSFGIIIFIILIVVLLAMSALLLIRFLVLYLLITTSPLGILGIAFPNFELAKKWFGALYSNLIFPPAMFMVLWFGFYILGQPPQGSPFISSAVKIVSSPDSSYNHGAWASFFGTILQYILVLAIVIMSIVVAKKSGAIGAEKMESWVNSTKNAITGAVGRNTIGRAARNLGVGLNNWYSAHSQGAQKDIEEGRSSFRRLVFGNRFLSAGARSIKDFTSEKLEQVRDAKYGSQYGLLERESYIRKQIAEEDRVENAKKGVTLMEEGRGDHNRYKAELNKIDEEEKNNKITSLQAIEKKRELSKALHASGTDSVVSYTSADGSRTITFQDASIKDEDGKIRGGKLRQALEHFDDQMDYHDIQELLVKQNRKDLLKDDLFTYMLRPDMKSSFVADSDNFSTAEREGMRSNHRRIMSEALDRGEYERYKIMNQTEMLQLSRNNQQKIFEVAAKFAEAGYTEEVLFDSNLLNAMIRAQRFTAGRKADVLESLQELGTALQAHGKITGNFKGLGSTWTEEDEGAVDFISILSWIASERNAKDFQHLIDAAGKLVDFSDQKSFSLKRPSSETVPKKQSVRIDLEDNAFL